MALLAEPNLTKIGTSDGAGFGRFAWRLKELAVRAGWTVRGSGDGQSRFAYDGETAALAASQQGSGGDFDCLITGLGNAVTQTAGDFGPEAWVVLENNGRELLIAATAQLAAGFEGWGRIAYKPAMRDFGGAIPNYSINAFDGSVAAAGTIPGAAQITFLYGDPPPTSYDIERWVFGSRASANGVNVFLDGIDGYVHLFANDAPENGVLSLGFMTSDTSGNPLACFAVTPIAAGTQSDSDDDHAVVLGAAAGMTVTSGCAAWNPGSQQMESFTLDAHDSNFYAGQGVVHPVSGDDQGTNIPARLGTGANEVDKGMMSVRGVLWTSVARTYPHLVQGPVDGEILTFCYHTSGFAFPWIDALTPPLP